MDKEHLSIDVTAHRQHKRFFWDLSGSPYSVRNSDGSPYSARNSNAISPRDDAAITLQKTYRGYRQRRQLADCAVIARDYGWWNVLEGIKLIQDANVDPDKRDASYRWSHAKILASKLGKGLSKDVKARKLAFEHWLEAIDAKHRYGHNIYKYYKVWIVSGTSQPFFYWLDLGEGIHAEVDGCSRAKLAKEQISYLGPFQRKEFEVSIVNGVWSYLDGTVIDTGEADDDDKWIFVMSTLGRIYVARKKKGKFQHSSFLAGGAATAAGRLVLRNGCLELLEAHSGHYRPTEGDFTYFLDTLKAKGVDMTKVKIEYASREMKAHKQTSKKMTSGEVTEDAGEAGTMDTADVTGIVDKWKHETREETSKPETSSVPVDSSGDCNGECSVAKPRPPMLDVKHHRGWSSEGGARITSLSIIPWDLRSKAMNVITTPRALATVRW